jgi:hypothetical protein
MRSSARVAWRIVAVLAFAATAAVAVAVSHGGSSMRASLDSAHPRPGADARAMTGIQRCAAAWLRVTVLGGKTARYALGFTNVSRASCALSGYPSVSAYGMRETPLGNAAARDTSVLAARVVLAPGKTAYAAISDDAADPASGSSHGGACHPVMAAGLRVGLPDAGSAWRYVPHPLAACSVSGTQGPVFLHVRPVEANLGLRGFSNRC